jgi:hypothetical protein
VPWEPATASCVIRGEIELEAFMGRALVLWLLGVPIPVLLLMWALGWLH